ncbi:MAG: adenylate/guanylate cyclase domain-containing protein [Myxococcota bacterium]
MPTRRTFRNGTLVQKAGFALLVAAFTMGLAIAIEDKLERIGQPDAGFGLNGDFIYPTRDDAADAGLRYGGRLLALNGLEPSSTWTWLNVRPGLQREPGAVNVIRLEGPDGEVRELSIPVREWRAADALYTQGAIDIIGLLMALLGIGAFLLRPWEPESWALLAITCLSGGALETLYVPQGPDLIVRPLYFSALIGFVYVVPFHVALALPKVHPWLASGTWPLRLIYTLGAALSLLGLAAFYTQGDGLEAIARPLGLGTLLLAITTLIVRSAWLALRASERVVRQRARILLSGTLFGFAPLGVVLFLQIGLRELALDARLAYWLLGIFFFAMARITVRGELLNARVAVRRAVLYATAVLGLTLIAAWLSALSPFAVALLLLPVLYLWPSYSARLDARLYPKRARLPELVRATGRELAAQGSVDGVLKVLAQVGERLVDSRSGVVALFPGVVDDRAHGVAHGIEPPAAELERGDGTLFRMLRVTRKELTRASVAVEPQFENVREELLRELDAFGAEIAVPMVDESERVVGLLALGPRAADEPYEAFELDVIGALVQQAWESIERAQALTRLHERERDFSDLKRFFPAAVIDQVMARGGAQALERKRKVVSVVFADLRGFTAFSDTVEPEEVTETLNEFHTAIGAHVTRWEGTLERFTGDGFMVFFNDPLEQRDHIERAARMALDMRASVAGLRERWRLKGYPIDLGLGLHTGYATCGFIGYEGRRDYGVIGNVTNLAERFSEAAQGGEILTSARVRSELTDSIASEPAGELALDGFAEPQRAFRLLA